MFVLKRLLKSRGGNFGVITALLIVPIAVCAGLAVDFTNAYEVKTQLMDAADAAALGAISDSSPALAQAQQMTQDGEITVGNQDGLALFLSQRNFELKQLPLNVSVKVTKTGGSIASSVTFSAQVPTAFMQILGNNSVPVSGTATAVYKSESYSDFYMLLDNSPSMGIGATQQDINILKAATANSGDAAGRNCAFACHMGSIDNNGKFQEDANSDYLIARANNVTLRIDEVTNAVNTLLSTLSTSSSPGQFRVAAYTLGSMASESGYSVQKVVGLTSDLGAASSAAGQIQLMVTPHHSYNDDALTSFDTAMTDVGKDMPLTGGTGTSAGSRQQVLFFVTDGVSDALQTTACGGGWADSNRCIEPINLAQCSALKARNIKIAILYTTYVPLTGDHLWDTYIKPFAPQIGTQLKQCASDNLYFEVSPSGDLQSALKALFIKAANTNLRLSS
ncbi:pilus assembly protein TadG-related protein [Rhizobium sp. BK376]|jgi:Flp pilus assembly protein TadG|uniref:pilus assembly protein TadG-related protein n=1 Tax=Rhizobium sp. BK376 TaxID=2512149 RepID=UPI0010487FC6|nr:pilus assembly protein TadG-related protein [Rhizobium sp. BK376]TCR90082.1 Flp pilus assembly protein TadG [Rhizobium sp. BK376]